MKPVLRQFSGVENLLGLQRSIQSRFPSPLMGQEAGRHSPTCSLCRWLQEGGEHRARGARQARAGRHRVPAPLLPAGPWAPPGAHQEEGEGMPGGGTHRVGPPESPSTGALGAEAGRLKAGKLRRQQRPHPSRRFQKGCAVFFETPKHLGHQNIQWAPQMVL